MNRQRIEELWTRYLGREELTAEEERELLEALRSQDELAADLLEDAEMEWLLEARGRVQGDPDALAQAFLDRVRAERDATRFIEKVRGQIPPVRHARRHLLRGRPRFSFLPALAGAAVILVLVVLWVNSMAARNPAPGPRTEAVRHDADAPKMDEKRAAPEPEAPPGRKSATPAPMPELGDTPRPQEEAREPQAPPPKDRAPSPVPAVEKKPPEPARPESRAAVATLERVQGEVYILKDAGKVAARKRDVIAAGEGLETAGPDGLAEVAYPDGTRVEVREKAVIRGITHADPKGSKRIFVERGTVAAQVAKQPPDRPMVFGTPHGEVRVLGTSLRIAVDKALARVEVEEGKVRVTRSDGRFVDILAGHFAVVSAGLAMAAKPLPVDEIVLLPQQGRIAGGEWRRVKDAAAFDGGALETVDVYRRPDYGTKVRELSRSWVEFTFRADADRPYHLWVRGMYMKADGTQDALVVEAPGGEFTGRPAGWFIPDKTVHYFNGYSKQAGYFWAGGDVGLGAAGVGRADVLATLRFARAGNQLIKLHVAEGPMRVDALWLSTSQKSPPSADQRPAALPR